MHFAVESAVYHSSAMQCWFGLDLPEMLAERDNLFEPIEEKPRNFVPTGADLRREGWEDKLASHGFDAQIPTFIILEGVSMYLKPDEFRDLGRRLAHLLKNNDSRLWLDHVTPAMLVLEHHEVRSFFDSMARLGEPFINGFESLEEVRNIGLGVESTESAAAVLGLSDDIHNEYRFTLAFAKPYP